MMHGGSDDLLVDLTTVSVSKMEGTSLLLSAFRCSWSVVKKFYYYFPPCFNHQPLQAIYMYVVVPACILLALCI